MLKYVGLMCLSILWSCDHQVSSHWCSYLIIGPICSRCMKSTRGRSLPRSRCTNVSVSWVRTDGTRMNVIVSPIHTTSSVFWYLLLSTEAHMNSAQYRTVVHSTLKGGWTLPWLITIMTPFSLGFAADCCATTSVMSCSVGVLFSIVYRYLSRSLYGSIRAAFMPLFMKSHRRRFWSQINRLRGACFYVNSAHMHTATYAVLWRTVT